MQKKSRKEIESLKLEWLDDPCWPLANSQGFEAHRGELQAFEDAETERYEKSREKTVKSFARAIKIPEHYDLAGFVWAMLERIETLEEQVQALTPDEDVCPDCGGILDEEHHQQEARNNGN